MMKICSSCSRPAEFSIVSIVSSVGMSKRLQKCSPAVLFCSRCLAKLLTHEHCSTDELRERVNSAYTALKELLRERGSTQNE